MKIDPAPPPVGIAAPAGPVAPPPAPPPPAAQAPVAPPPAPAAASADTHASAGAGKFAGAVTGGLPEAQQASATGGARAVTEIDPTRPVRFAGNVGAAEALMMHAPQKHGVECGGYSIAYTLIHSGASRTQAQRQHDVDATLSLARAMGYTPSAQERAALTAYASGSMTAGQVQTMGEMYYLMARGTLANSSQTGFSSAQLTRMVTDLMAFGAFEGVHAEIRLDTLPPSGAHFTMRHNGVTGNSMANGAGKAAVQSDMNAGLPAGSHRLATITINGNGSPPSVEMERASDHKSATITQPRLPAAERDKEHFRQVDNAGLGVLVAAGIDQT